MEVSVKQLRILACAVLLGGALALTGCMEQTTYEPSAKDAAVDDSALVTAGTLTVGVDTSEGKAPLAGVSGSGKIVGMDVDFAVWLADELGLKLEVVDVSGAAKEAVDNGTVDILLGVSTDDDSVSGLWLSDAYLETAISLFATDAAAEVPADDSEPQISAEAAKSSAVTVANEFGGNSLVSCNDMGEVFELLADGSVQYAAADALIGSYAAKTVSCEAYVIALLANPTGYCVATSAENTELQDAVASAVKRLLSNGIYDKMVEMRWLGVNYSLDGVPYTEWALNYAEDEETEAEGEDTEGEGESEGEGEAEAA